MTFDIAQEINKENFFEDIYLPRYLNDPVRWIEEILYAEPLEDWAIDALNGLVEKRFLAVRSGSGVGKTALLAFVIEWFLTTRVNSIVICTAPTAPQLEVQLWKEAIHWIKNSKGNLLETILTWNKKKIMVKGHEEEWFAIARTARVEGSGEVTEGLSGFHAPYLLYIVDEASGVHEKVYAALEGSLTEINAYAVIASNPVRRVGSFARAFLDSEESKLWHKVHIKSTDSKRVSPLYAKRQAARFGVNSDIYRAKVLGEFPKDMGGVDSIFDPSDFDKIANDEYSDIEPEVISVGLDVARFGNDLSVIIVLHGNKVIKIDSRGKMDTEDVASWAWYVLTNISNEYPALDVHCNVDSVGIGAGVHDILNNKAKAHNRQVKVSGRIYIHSVENNRKAEDPMYYNVRSEALFNTKERIKNGNVYFSADANHPRVIEDISDIKYSFKDGKILAEPKEKIKDRRDGISPDFGDAFILATNVYHKTSIIRVPLNVMVHKAQSDARTRLGAELKKPSRIRLTGKNPGFVNWSG